MSPFNRALLTAILLTVLICTLVVTQNYVPRPPIVRTGTIDMEDMEELAVLGIAILVYIAGLCNGLMVGRTPRMQLRIKDDLTNVKFFKVTVQGHLVCSHCDGATLGDGYTSVVHCENALLEDYWDLEPDADPVYCGKA